MKKEPTYEELVDRLQHMDAELKQYREYLEQIVSQATQTLQEKNKALENEIKERKRVTESLRESKERLSIALEVSQAGIWEWNTKTNAYYFDDRFYELLGYEKNDQHWNPHMLEAMTGPDEFAEIKQRYHNIATGVTTDFDHEIRIRTRTGEWRWLHSRAKVVHWDHEGNPELVIGNSIDITEHKRLIAQLEESRQNLENTNRQLEEAVFKSNQMTANAEIRSYNLEHEIERRKRTEAMLRESEKKYRSIIENIEDGYCEMDGAWNIIFFNNSLCKILDIPAMDLAGRNWSTVLDPANVDAVFKTFSTALVTENSKSGYHCKIIRKDDSVKHIELSLTPMWDAAGQKTGLRSVVRDVDQRTQYEKKLIYLAYHDALTGLNNRKAFYERLEQALSHARRYETDVALLYIDIDKFKQVNDTYGHETGDALLKEITSRLNTCLRNTDCVSRIGGDEFTVIMNNPRQPTPDAAAARIVKEIARPYRIDGKSIDFITASVGISVYPGDARDMDALISLADGAMYTAKENRNGFCDHIGEGRKHQVCEG